MSVSEAVRNPLMTRAALIDRYGLRLTMEQLGEVLGYKPQSLYNMIADGDLKIATYKEGNRRYASYDAVADYLDSMAELARTSLDR